MIVKDIDTLIQYGGTGYALSYETVKPYLLAVEYDHLAPLISHDLYTALDAYDPENPAPGSKLGELLPLAKAVICKLALAEGIDFLQVQITDNGVMRTEKTDSKSAYHYQKTEAKDAFNRGGFKAEDTLLAYLEANADHAEFTGWKEAEGYTIAREYMLSSAVEFHQYYSIDKSRRTFLALAGIMGRVEEITIQEAIGEGLFTEIKEEITAGSISAENQSILKRFLKPALAYLTIAAAAEELSLEVTHKGVILSQTLAANMNVGEKKAPPSNRIEVLSSKAQTTGLLYLSKLRTFLIREASATKYAPFYTSELYPKPITEQTPRQEDTPRRRRTYSGL